MECAECDGAWSCDDIYEITLEIMAAIDSNGDGSINLGDNIEEEHLDILNEYCDTDGNGSINQCELHACVIMAENEWRAEYCPDYGFVYCEAAFTCDSCEGEWSCDDIAYITEEVMAYYDTTSDEAINPEDAIEEEHYATLQEYCDFNNDGSIDACEIH